jgi:hypothetical protein
MPKEREMVMATIGPRCYRSKSRTRPSYRLYCWRWNPRVRRRPSSAALAAEHYCVPAVTKRSASREEQQECAAA